MKNILLLSALQLFLFLPTSAQQFTDLNNEWHIAVFPPTDIDRVTFRPQGDTIIDGMTYRTFFRFDARTPAGVRINTLARESGGKVFFRRIDDSEEYLYYDLNASVGDTLFKEEVCRQVVLSIDSIRLQNGEVRKRMGLGLTTHENDSLVVTAYWIAGIGNTALETFAPIHAECISGPYSSLACYYYAGEFAYPESDEFCFSTALQNESNATDWQVFPNPVRDGFYVKSTDATQKMTSIQLFKATGELVKQLSVQSNSDVIETSDLPPGVYFLKVHTADRQTVVKKIIRY